MSIESKLAQQWQDKFHKCLALEFSNPEYFEVHHLLVLTYMLQTSGYNDEYFNMARNLLRNFLDNSLTTNAFIMQYKQIDTGSNLNIHSGNFETEKFAWNLDIRSLRTDTAEQYRIDIKTWATDVLRIIDDTYF